MTKKNATDERFEKLEQDIQAMRLSTEESRRNTDAKFDELKKLLTRPPRRRGRPPSPRRHRKKEDSGGGEETEDEGDGHQTEEESSRDSTPVRRNHRVRGRKLEIPVFDGGEAYNWLVKVERYFLINGVEEDEMLDAVIIALDGKALNWYQWWEDQHHDPSWDEFKQAIIRRFQPSLVRNPPGLIPNVRQTGSVMEYRERFELLMAPLKRHERGMLESIFINGLRDDIQAELKLHSTRGLNAVMDRALLIEERNEAMKKEREAGREKLEGSKWKSGSGGSGWETGRIKVVVTRPRNDSVTNSTSAVINTTPPENAEKKQVTGKKLTQDELRELSRKGLCFKCGERWGRDHICKLKHYRVILIDDEGEEAAELTEHEIEEEAVATVEIKTLQLSLKSKEGLTTNQSFKVWGIINGRRVLILIDSGASSNFIFYKLVEEL